MLDFCALHKIKPEITKLSMNGTDEAWSQVMAKKARYRFVTDMNASNLNKKERRTTCEEL